MTDRSSKNQFDPKTGARAAGNALNPPAQEPEEETIGINLPEQEPPAEIITPELKAEAAALEAFNLRPRTLLPPHKLRAQEYPAKYPTPGLAEEFKNYHKKTLAAFSRAHGEPAADDKNHPTWKKLLNRLKNMPRATKDRQEKKLAHEIEVILAFARHKKKITNEDVRILLGLNKERAAFYLNRLTNDGRLISAPGPEAVYKPKTY